MPSRDDKAYLQAEDKNIFPGRVYREVILEPHFRDAKERLLENTMTMHYAHGLMLAEEGIIAREEMGKIFAALRALEEVEDWQYDPQSEDMFFRMECRLEEQVGSNVAGQLHTGRSRNDIDATIYRMVIREKILRLADQLMDFRRVILRMIGEHMETVILGYTHTQPAQPTTLAHYLGAAADFLARDFQRLREYYVRLNLSPMGAGALTTTSFPINRDSVARYLGFDGLVENSYDSVGGSDYMAEASAVLVVMMTSLTRLLYDILLYTMVEFNAVRVSEAYVQVSSIMPQKRNPVSLEHSRALANAVLGEAHVVTGMLTNTPFGDIVDKEQESQRHLWQALDRAVQLYRLLTVVFSGMEINRDVLQRRAGESFAVVTQLAEAIVQYTDLSFRTAHHVVSRVVKQAIAEGKCVTEIDAAMVNACGLAVTGKTLRLTEEMVRESLDPRRFVELRDRPGGPAPKEMQRQLAERERELALDEEWVEGKWQAIQKSEEVLRTGVDELLAGTLLTV